MSGRVTSGPAPALYTAVMVMERLTEEQRVGVESIRAQLVDARTTLERLGLPDPVIATIWDRISNAHANLGRVLENDRILRLTRRTAAA